jgi:hypothetical protein
MGQGVGEEKERWVAWLLFCKGLMMHALCDDQVSSGKQRLIYSYNNDECLDAVFSPVKNLEVIDCPSA